MNKTSQTHIHPNYTSKVQIEYIIEYTEKDEVIKDDYSNVKKVNCLDLEQMVKSMFELRQLNKFNINLYTKTEVEGQWITEDNANDCEIYSSSAMEKRKDKNISNLENTIEEQQKEIELYKSFLTRYNSSGIFEKWRMAEESKHTYYFRLRPPSPGCQPSNGLLEMNGEKIIHNEREYWGSCTYDRELTDKELYEYDLDK